MYFQFFSGAGRRRISASLLSLPLLMLVFTGCKKEDTVDYPSLFNNTSWSGTLKYANDPHLFTIKFSADGTFQWLDYGGMKDGKWTLNGNKLSLKYSNYFSLDKNVETTISKNKTWTDIKIDNVDGLSIQTIQLNTFTELPLEGTIWKGDQATLSFVNGTGMKFTGLYSYQPPTVSCNYIRALGFVFFPTPPSGSETFYAQIQPDGKTMKVRVGPNKWFALSKQ